MKFYRRVMRLIGRTCEDERQVFRREIAHLNATGEDMQRTITTHVNALREAAASVSKNPPPKILP